jgi:hypothetical protein
LCARRNRAANRKTNPNTMEFLRNPNRHPHRRDRDFPAWSGGEHRRLRSQIVSYLLGVLTAVICSAC